MEKVYKMKKKVMAVLLTLITVISLTACGEPFTCGICGEEKTGRKHKEVILGAEITCCQDCYNDLKK